MNLAFVFGTAGELIKLYPLLVMAEQRGLDWTAYSTGQSGVNGRVQWEEFGLPRNRLHPVLETHTDLRTSQEALRWFFRATRLSKAQLRMHLGPDSLILVHGDTLSTMVRRISPLIPAFFKFSSAHASGGK